MMKAMFVLMAMAAVLVLAGCEAQTFHKWPMHDMDRPKPVMIMPAETTDQPPSDAIVLFDGNGMAAWNMGNPHYQSDSDSFDVHAAKGVTTKQAFGDCQLHIEWTTPVDSDKKGQRSGNSGVFLMSKYEVQVLNSYENITYADGQAGALYGQNPPLVNVSLKPGQWQSFDIIFRGPKFGIFGIVLQKARITVFQNGVLIQDNFEFTGQTTHKIKPKYRQHADKLPLKLQDHHDPVRYRNIWIREL